MQCYGNTIGTLAPRVSVMDYRKQAGVETGRGVGAGCNLSCMPPIQFDSIQIEMLFNYR